MSHVRNVQAFEKLLGVCTGLGGTYKPGKQNLRVSVMHSMLVKAQQALSEVSDAVTLFNNATNQREELFERTDKLAFSIFNVLQASGANALTIEDARRAYRRLVAGNPGSGNHKLPTPEVKNALAKSGYGRDYVTRVHNFEDLINIVSKDANYQPVEPVLSLEYLQQHATAMHTANAVVLQASLTLAKARIKRNEVMYKGETSLYKIAKAVKLYVRGILGTGNPEYQLLLEARFDKLM